MLFSKNDTQRTWLSLKVTKRRPIHANYVYSCIDSISYIFPFMGNAQAKQVRACDR